MASWNAHDRELYVEKNNPTLKEIHCREIISRLDKWENPHPGNRNNGAI